MVYTNSNLKSMKSCITHTHCLLFIIDPFGEMIYVSELDRRLTIIMNYSSSICKIILHGKIGSTVSQSASQEGSPNFNYLYN